MSQPPEEPPEQRPGEGWHPPGPPPQPSSQPPPPPPPPPPGQYPGYPPPPGHGPPGQNPYGGGTTSFYRPIESGGMPRSLKIVLGVLIGAVGGFFLWFVAAIGFAGTSGSGNEFLFYAAVAPLLVPAPLLIWKATRPWAIGLLMGTALASIGMSSLCSAMISSLEGA